MQQLIISIVMLFSVGMFTYNLNNKIASEEKVKNAIIQFEERTDEKVQLEGYDVIGTIRIPKIELEYPILDKVTKKSLETSVAKLYTLNGLNKPGNTAILGNNYKNGQFFSNINKLEEGDYIYIKDVSGTELKYVVTKKTKASATDASFYATKDPSKTCVTLASVLYEDPDNGQRMIVIAEINN